MFLFFPYWVCAGDEEGKWKPDPKFQQLQILDLLSVACITDHYVIPTYFSFVLLIDSLTLGWAPPPKRGRGAAPAGKFAFKAGRLRGPWGPWWLSINDIDTWPGFMSRSFSGCHPGEQWPVCSGLSTLSLGFLSFSTCQPELVWVSMFLLAATMAPLQLSVVVIIMFQLFCSFSPGQSKACSAGNRTQPRTGFMKRLLWFPKVAQIQDSSGLTSLGLKKLFLRWGSFWESRRNPIWGQLWLVYICSS